MIQQALDKAKSAVLRVGRGGRGFVVKGRDWHKLVICASHCLPRLPKTGCHAKAGCTEVYQNVLGPLGSKSNVWAECLFVDPVADIAVLGSVDDQSLSEEAEAYEELIEPIRPIPIAAMEDPTNAWLLSLAGEWFECQARFLEWTDGYLFLCEPGKPIEGGMSGSPIIDQKGRAIGVVATNDFCPRLTRDLPGWLLGIHSLGGSLLTSRKRKVALEARHSGRARVRASEDL
jgi:hypothetical protein